MTSKDDGYRLVYSTDTGEVCPGCGAPRAKCACEDRKRATVLGDGKVRVRKETKGRGGKTVSVVAGLPLNETELAALCKELKRSCGTGGTVKDGTIEIQGDHVDLLRTQLGKRGYVPK